MKIISLENLPNNFRIGLDTEFRKALFNTCIKKISMNSLVKELEYAKKTIETLRRGYVSGGKNKKIRRRFLKAKTLRKLAQIANVSFEKVESHITEINSVNASLKIKLPIYSTRELTSLIGHCFGDGYVGTYFGYFNKCKDLIDEVRKNVECIFKLRGNVIKNRGVYFLYFPGIVSQMLKLAGTPVGNKIKQILKVPIWIKNGNETIKSSFLRALFDDEASVKFRGYNRLIQFRLFKNENLIKQHKEFIQDLQELLLDLDIKTTNLHEFKGTENGRYGKTIGVGFEISGQENLLKFLEKIDFAHPNKNNKLAMGIKSYKQIQYRKYEINKLILRELNNGPRDAHIIADKLNRDYEYMLRRLRDLCNKGLIKKLDSTDAKLWKISTIK